MHKRASDLFLACCDMSADDRATYLAERCGDDRALMEEVEGMFAFEEKRPDFLETSAIRRLLASHGEELPATIGPYQIRGKLGEGGMGAVYLAVQERPHRTVALKVLKPHLLSPTALKRFEQEGEYLGRLQHPGIAHIFDSGRAETTSGMQPFFALELVRGEPITNHARKLDLSTFDRLELLARVADAVQHAHQHGVIHRDLKPANILVDDSGQPKVLDFGIARATDADIQLTSLHTDIGQILGTLAYMSPEQASGDPKLVDTRSDVYSLGVILYELLTGRLPHDVSSKLLPEAVRLISEETPPRLGSLERAHQGDLETIVHKALEKDKERRYSSAAAFASDIRHYLRNEPIDARPPSRLYTLSKLVQRNKPLAGSLATGFIVLVGGLVTSVVLAERARETAAREKQRADEVLRLSAIQRLDDLVREADRLWPPWPARLPDYDAWISKAGALLAGLEPNAAEGDRGHRAQLAKLKDRALPLGQEQREAARLAHPRIKELESLRVTCAAFERARAVRAGEAEPEVVSLDHASLPTSADELIELATPLVDLQRKSFGQEARGLALARLALERAASDEARSRANTILSQALFAVGKPSEALETMDTAVALAPEALRREVEILRTRLHSWYEGGLGPGGATETAGLMAELEALEAELSEHREWHFESDTDRWWFNQVQALIEDLESFEASFVADDAIAGTHGWSIGRRRQHALELQSGFDTAGSHAQAWNEALPAIEAAYDGLQLAPQMGLVPIGADPDSGLWEFWHPATGSMPDRGSDGRLIMTDSSSLVFVLLAGGTFTAGAQSRDPAGTNYDPMAEPGAEATPHEETLAPFFLSKYEMTQGQWQRVTGEIPCYYSPGTNVAGVVTSARHPVENISWSDCWITLGRLGLTIPSEVQWEYGTRAGTSGPWWSGDDSNSLEGAANLADEFCEKNGAAAWGPVFMPWDDGYIVHAPVGSFLPNAFGLHDVHGNLWEWCLDPYAPDRRHPDFSFRELDPLEPVEDGPLRPYRGGSFGMTGDVARCTKHGVDAPVKTDPYLGIRPARSVRGI